MSTIEESQEKKRKGYIWKFEKEDNLKRDVIFTLAAD